MNVEINRKLSKLDWPRAISDAESNWKTWASCFESPDTIRFSDLDVVANVHVFQSFIFEYSVGRGFTLSELRSLRETLLKISDPKCFTAFHKIVFNALNENRDGTAKKARNCVSMCSKLLSLWQPSRYFMLDSLNRPALRRIVRPTRGNSYHDGNPNCYENFAKAFRELDREAKKHFIQQFSEEQKLRSGFSYRVLDNALMNEERRKNAER